MSTDERAMRPSERHAELKEAAQRRTFRRTSLVLVIVLAVLAVGLGAANATQGPKLSSASVNAEAAIARPGQRIVMDANQPVAAVDAADVRVVPQTPVEVASDGATVTVRFTGLLHYATEYTVEVDVRGTATGAAGTLRHTFATPSINVFSLQRTGAGDRILRHDLAATDADAAVMFEAPRIQEYAAIGSGVAAITLDESDAPTLRVVFPDDGIDQAVTTAPGALRELHAAPVGDLVGFLVDVPAGDDPEATDTSRLYLYDLGGAGIPTEVLGAAGESLAVIDWAFVPGTSSLVVQTPDHSMFLVDTSGTTPPTPLGQHTELRGFLPGTAQLLVADPTSGSLIDLATGETTVLDLPLPEVDSRLTPSSLLLLDDTSYVELYGNPFGTDASPYRSVLFATGPEGSRELFHPASDTSRITRVCLSPNGQYVSVEVVASDATPDRYPMQPGYADTTIYFVDTATGAADRGVVGMLPDWCG